MRKLAQRFLLYVLLVFLVSLSIFLWKGFPVITGYGAKVLCSGVFVSGRDAKEVIRQDLHSYPLSLASYHVDFRGHTVTATVFGLAKKEAVYRSGLGATLINDLSEGELRSQHFHLAPPPKLDQDTIDWPIGDRIRDSVIPRLDYNKISRGVKDLFEEGDSSNRPTRALIIVYRGQLIAERYARGFTKNTPQNGWSMTKSIINAILGILAGKGKINVDSAAPIAAWKKDNRSAITISDLMHMTSGLKWWEFYFAPSEATNMLFKSDNMGGFATSSPLAHSVGTHFTYSSGSANILSMIIRKTLSDSAYYTFPYQQLFYRIGMLHTLLEIDASGTFVGSSYCYATPRDWARFGMLYLQDGFWNNEHILPPGWVKYSTSASADSHLGSGGRYGALWWLNAGEPGNATRRAYPHVPSDCFSCQGFEGQYIWVVPSKHLVVVRLAKDPDRFLNPDKFLSQIIGALPP